MPRGDGTGPLGKGPLTGWGQGKCKSGNNTVKNGRRRRCVVSGRGWGKTLGDMSGQEKLQND